MRTSARVLDAKTFAIGVLAVTACVLFVGFLLVTMTPRPAYAIGHLDRNEDYIMLTQQVSNSTEALLIIDAAVKQMNVYGLQGQKDLRLLQRIRLDRLPGTQEEEARRGRNP